MDSSKEQASNAVEDEQEESEELLDDEEHTQTSNPKKRKRAYKSRSVHWDAYDRTIIFEGDPPVEALKGKCKTCHTLIAAHTKRNGTTALKNHTISCRRKFADSKQQAILNLKPNEAVGGSGMGSLTNWKFDQDVGRKSMCRMVLRDELPFRFVEHEGFKDFVADICPMFKIPSRKTVKEDCIRLFLNEKGVLKSFFAKKNMGRVSFTTDCWTASNNSSYICVTAHCIGEDWRLHKKIITFRKIFGHTGDDIAHALIETINDWELKMLICCTVDNATANDKAIQYVRGFLDTRNSVILGGKYLHLRCSAHIINLIVNDGLDEIGSSVRRVREAVKWVKASSIRTEQFLSCAKALKINSKRFLSLDVPTRWNSTFLMLQAAEPYESTLKLFGSMKDITLVADLNKKTYNGAPIGPPEEEDWSNVRKMMEYLKKFYELTKLLSGSKYATIHRFLPEMCDLLDLVLELEKSSDIEVSFMASKMRRKLEKYWLEFDTLNPRMNKVLYIAAVLDPRQKMRHVERCLKKVYGSVRAVELMKDVNESVVEMFELYKKMLFTNSLPSSAPSQSSASCESLDEDRDDRRGSCSLYLDDFSSDDEDSSDNSELTIYLADKYKKESKSEFEILVWWSMNCTRFPILAEMAKDILAIPVSTVASESAFSTGGRVLDDFRSSLDPSTVEALICTEDWLRSSSTKKLDVEDLPEEKQEEEFLNVLKSIGVEGRKAD